MKKIYILMSKDGHASFSNLASIYINIEDLSVIPIKDLDKDINFLRTNRIVLIKYLLHYVVSTLLKINNDKFIKFKNGEKKQLEKILEKILKI